MTYATLKKCLKGHLFTEQNSYWASGKRRCKKCKCAIERQYYQTEKKKFRNIKEN